MRHSSRDRITVTTVAEHAGVSRAAVYAVLNSQKKLNIGVSEKTRRKVLEAIRTLGYSPNDSARGLVSGQTRNIGLLLASPDSRLSIRLMGAVSDRFASKGYMVIGDYSGNDPATEREKLEMFLRKRVDCLIVSRLSPDINADVLALYEQYHIPVLVLGREVAFDERAVMENVASHLSAAGVHRLFFAGYSDRRLFANAERRQFLIDALRNHPGLRLTGSATLQGSGDCRKLAERLCSRTPVRRPQVLICYNDQLAHAMLTHLELAGMRVPADIGIIGIDGYPDPFDRLKLTGVRLPVEKMAQALWRAFAHSRPTGSAIIAPEWVEGETI